MKRGGTFAFLGLIALALAFRLLAVLQDRALTPTVAPEPGRRPVPRPTAPPSPKGPPATIAPPTPPPLPEAYRDHVGARRLFERRDSAWAYTLTFGFIDHHGRAHDVSCDVSRADHEWQVSSFGYDRASMDAEIDARLTRVIDAELASRRLEGDVRIRFRDGGGYEARSAVPSDLDAAERAGRLARVKEFMGWLDGPFVARRDATVREVFAQKGLRLEGNRFMADHAVLAARASRALGGCFEALRSAGADYGERQRLGLFLAFMQEIRYEVPQAGRGGGRDALGLFVPTEVLVDNHGDCDSKSVAFASLWRNFDSPLLLIILPDHMLVGVAVTPGPGEHYVQLGLRYFVLCEVAGPGKLHPGRKPIPDRFEYVLIEPAASGRAPKRGRS